MPMRSWMRGTATMSALAFGATVLGAQAPKCSIPTQSDPALLKANVTFGGAFKANAKPEEKAKALAATVRALTDSATKYTAMSGRNFMLGQALLVWLDQPGTAGVEPRGKIGYAQNPDGTVDLALAIDTAFTAIRAEKPECGDSLRLYTGNLWGAAVNKGVDFLNKGEPDSAAVWAQRSIRLNPTSHYGFQVMAGVAQLKDDTTMMLTWFDRGASVGLASADTTARKFGESMLQNLAFVYQNASVDAQEPRKGELARKAVETYKRLLALNPNDFTTRLRILRLEGAAIDSAAAAKLVAELQAAGDAVTDAQLVDVGNELAKNQQYTAGLTVFGMALKRNPSNRDALYNSAVALNNLERFEEMAPYFTKLRTIDPNNPGIFTLSQNTIRARRLAIQTKANKGVRPKPNQTVTLTPAQAAQMKVLQDSLIAYSNQAQAMTPIVQVSQFSPTEGGARFAAFVQVPPSKTAGTFRVTVEFLNAQEQVVATGTATTKAIEPGSGEPITVEVKGAKIVAFRYTVAK